VPASAVRDSLRGSVTQIDGSRLADQLTQAIEEYQEGWQPVDSELYDLCRRRPSQRDFADVFTKVAIISAVYSAGLDRTWRGSGDPVVETARCLISQAELLDRALNKLRNRHLDRTSLVEIVALHGSVTRALSFPAGNIWLTSPVSKYLHFHCPIVPIYDGRADNHIRRFVDRTDTYRLQALLAEPDDWAKPYFKFARAFLVLYEQIYTETSLRPTVKEVDHLLWRKP
jgi:hypothetical protein